MTTADGALTRMWDPDAWTMQVEVVYERRAQHLYEFARRLRLDHERADDAMQEAFARLLVHGRRGRIDNPDAWLFRTVRNLAMDVHRGNRRLLVYDVVLTSITPSADDRTQVWEAVDALPERQRLAVYLRFRADLDYAAIAKVLGISASGARANVFRGIAALRNKMEGLG